MAKLKFTLALDVDPDWFDISDKDVTEDQLCHALQEKFDEDPNHFVDTLLQVDGEHMILDGADVAKAEFVSWE